MNRWERRFLKSQENEFEDGSNPNLNLPENSDPSGSGIETGFNLPELKDKTPAEIEEAFKVYKAAVAEQGNRLNRLENERNNNPPAPVIAKNDDEEEVTPEKFWENPGKNISKVVSREINKQLKEIVAPLEMDFAAQRVRRVWDELGDLHPTYVNYKSLMLEILKSNRIENPNLPTLISVFEMAVGKAALSGNVPHQSENNANSDANGRPPVARRPAPPQHSPSSQPLPNAQPKKPKRRELTESERAVAKMQGLTHDQYLDELDRAVGDLEPTKTT